MISDTSDKNLIWHNFKTTISSIELPEKFTFPFYYEPHTLAKIAAEELQEYLSNQTDWEHNFGIDKNKEGLIIGKMFGVLVVKDRLEKLGYLSSFSGKLANKNNIKGFVPPIFDMLDENGFFLKEEKVLNNINSEIEVLENQTVYKELQESLKAETQLATELITTKKEELKRLKKERKEKRELFTKAVDSIEYKEFNDDLIKQSLRDKHELDVLKHNCESKLQNIQNTLDDFKNKIVQLRELRKNKSNALQQKLFDQYNFLNADGDTKSLIDIFKNTSLEKPPAAAGDCAAPKLLQYAYENQLQPIAMAEFWWGQSPKSEIRKHGHFYPSCRGKCEPILGHMLKGLSVDDNPLIINPAIGVDIEIVYEDDELAVVNKPAEFLSVPGIYIQDSVFERMKQRYPKATGPLIVHRLDMSTSGLMVIAKNMEVYHHLQNQFIKRTVQKRYTAVLNGIIQGEQGVIDLPLRVDLDDRPRQLVCYEYGKPAKTKWEVKEVKDGKTLIHFWPITGRTHQLRVHSAHSSGLNCPILGDDLYGDKSDRLYLHAEYLEFTHPTSKEKMCFEVAPKF